MIFSILVHFRASSFFYLFSTLTEIVKVLNRLNLKFFSAYYFAMPALAVKCSLAHIAKTEGDPIWPDGKVLFVLKLT